MSSRKACTSCGAVSTPQWREGPYGPRTLCNACGVRHLRRDNGRPSDRKAQAKLVRRKAHAAPAVKENKATSTKVKTKTNKRQKQQGSNAQSCSDGLKEQSQPSQQSVQDWYQESASLSDAQHSSHPSIEDNAAANLVAMSKPNMFMDDMGVHSNDAWYPAKDASYPFAKENPSDSDSQACEQLVSTEAELQAQFLTGMAAMREEVEAAEKKLSAANAAVDAVSQVLVAKQAAVTAAWAVMVDANQRLQQHMKQEPDFHEMPPCKRVKMF